MSTKSPTLKRILREAAELASSPSPDYHAAPLEQDLFEWHFTIAGPPSPSPFAGGLYHGRINLPPAYPLKPPSFRFFTPSGRFEVNREICLSISGHHEETWQPAWGIRTALVAIRSFMDTEAKGQLGGMDAGEDVRKRWAERSRGWRCAVCGGNEEVMRAVEERVKEAGRAEEEVVPEGLRLAYREEANGGEQVPSSTVDSTDADAPATVAQQPQPQPAATQPTPAAPQQVVPPRPDEGVPPWVDKAIFGVIGALLYLIFKRFS